MKAILIALALVSATLADQEFYNFKTTFGLDPLFGEAFADQPRTETEAKEAGFLKISDCGENEDFIGNLYVPTEKGQEFIIIYDVNGFIAGMHSVVSVDSTFDDEYFDFKTNPWYRKTYLVGIEAYVTTAYFVKPDIICSTGRTQEEYDAQGTLSNGLWFLNGDELVAAPMTEESAEHSTYWYKHFCVVSMGWHYLTLDPAANADEAPCRAIEPVQLLYDDGALNGFVWQHIAIPTGDRWEHPDSGGIGFVIDNPPKCLLDISDNPGVRSMHVYVSHWDPLEVNCIFGK